MNKKSISRALTRKIASRRQTLTGNGVTATKKEIVSVDHL